MPGRENSIPVMYVTPFHAQSNHGRESGNRRTLKPWLTLLHPSAWLLYDESIDVPSATPVFWQGQSLTWQIMARVNNDAHCLFGCANSSLETAQQADISFTLTRTLISLNAGSTTFVLDFFSPVSLTDYVRQSIPYIT